MFGLLRWLTHRRYKESHRHGGWTKGSRGGSLNGHSTCTNVTTVTSPLAMPSGHSEPIFALPTPVPRLAINRSISVPDESFVPQQSDQFLNVPQTNVVLNDNIYWEIASRKNSVGLQQQSPVRREIVHNVLYSTTDVV